MWVAIYNDAGSGGTVRVEEFRERADVVTAVSQFENEHMPPVTGYAGIDAGWSAYVGSASQKEWHVDRDAVPGPALIAVSQFPNITFQAALAIPESTILSTSWEVMGGVVSETGLFVENVSDAVGSVTGYVRVDGGKFIIRLSKSELLVPISDEYVHLDTAGEWEFFQFFTNADPDLSRQVYTLEGMLADGAASAEIRFGSVSILRKEW